MGWTKHSEQEIDGVIYDVETTGWNWDSVKAEMVGEFRLSLAGVVMPGTSGYALLESDEIGGAVQTATEQNLIENIVANFRGV